MNQRLEAFSDGVFAIAITLLILEIKVPPLESVHSVDDVWRALGKLWPSFFALAWSFTIILISWIGHHNLVRTLDKTSSQFQLANGFFLFTVIFIPFPTAFMAEYLNTEYAQPAIVFYCFNNILHNIGWNLLHRYMLKPKPLVRAASIEAATKAASGAKMGFFIYLGIIIIAWWLSYVAIILSLLIWIYWLYLSIAFKRIHQE